jgi:ferredoxin--NADP+ reductase
VRRVAGTAGTHTAWTAQPCAKLWGYAAREDALIKPRGRACFLQPGQRAAPLRAFAQLVYERRSGWNGQMRLFDGGRSGLDLMYASDEKSDLTNYYDEKTFEAFKAMGTRPLMSSSQALGQGMRAHAAETWGMIQQPNTYIFVSGLGKIAQVLDRLMAEQAGGDDAWRQVKQGLIAEGRWYQLIYG